MIPAPDTATVQAGIRHTADTDAADRLARHVTPGGAA